jgi:hypothetical protein
MTPEGLKKKLKIERAFGKHSTSSRFIQNMMDVIEHHLAQS